MNFSFGYKNLFVGRVPGRLAVLRSFADSQITDCQNVNIKIMDRQNVDFHITDCQNVNIKIMDRQNVDFLITDRQNVDNQIVGTVDGYHLTPAGGCNG
jgi:ABC-type uncharacterized transport system permease subunit